MARRCGVAAKREPKGFNFGIGKIGLGGLVEGMEKLFDLANRLKEAGGEVVKEGEIDLSKIKKGMKAMYGISLKGTVGGKPIIETFGNVKHTPKGAVVSEEREPIVDVFDEKDEVVIVAEMPGIVEEDIKLELKEDILDISATGTDRVYKKKVTIPKGTKGEISKHSYQSGLLKIVIKK